MKRLKCPGMVWRSCETSTPILAGRLSQDLGIRSANDAAFAGALDVDRRFSPVQASHNLRVEVGVGLKT